MFKTIKDRDRIARAQSQLEKHVQAAATRSGVLMLGYQGGGHEATCHFMAALDFWIAFADSGNRYWNALGIGNPFESNHTIIVEINPPKAGLDRRISGVFVEDRFGNVHLAHRGKVGGGRPGIGMKAFLSWYPGNRILVNDAEGQSEVIVVSALDDKKLLDHLAAFTKKVANFKAAATVPRDSAIW